MNEYHPFDTIVVSESSSQKSVIAPTKGRVVIAFKGTDSKSDVVADSSAVPKVLPNGKVHTGFYSRSELIPIILLINILKQGKELILCGHSLGGAVAHVTMIRLLESELFANLPNKQDLKVLDSEC
jgi:hypothetical protein